MTTDSNASTSPWRALIGGFLIGALLLAAGIGVWQYVESRREAERAAAGAKPVTAPAAPQPDPGADPEPAAVAPAPATLRRPAVRPKTVLETAPEPVAAPELGALMVQSDVTGANVFVDRVFVGPAPATAKNLSIGSHQLNVSADGYDGISRSVNIAAGENTVSVAFKEIRLNTAIDVIHRHTFGSCQGRLVADASGVRYETTNKQDAFTITFADLAPFEVDYMKKMLRIGRRGGKDYTFTDNKPTADTLFVFHRDVQKVRMKLMQK